MTPEQSEFIRIIMDGGTWRKAREELGIGNRTISAWMQEPKFREQYARATDVRADAIFEDMLDIADDASLPPDERRIRLDTRKWLAGKMKPKVYGDRVTTDVNHSGSIEVATKEQRDASVAAALRADS